MNKKKRKILALGAHPDDIELGCGGTLRAHILNGDHVYYVVASFGERSGDKNRRNYETMAAAKFMGVQDVHFLNLPDTEMMHNGTTITLLDKCLERIKPDIIYVHSPKDYHQDHANIAKSVLSASRKTKSSIFLYESPSTTIEFKPALYVDISDAIEFKLKCINHYATQKNKEYMKGEAIKGLARFRGYSVGAEYAEAFEVARLRLFELEGRRGKYEKR